MSRDLLHGAVVHVGYHKTATSWLQRELFGRPAHGYVQPWTRREVGEALVLPTPWAFDADSARRALLDAADPVDGSRRVVVSHEALSGNPHVGGVYGAATGWIVAERLARVAPGARPLIVIREQRAAIASTYRQYVRAGGAASPRRYLRGPIGPRHRAPIFSADHFAYDRLVGRYRDLFGADRVLVLAYEQLRDDPGAFAAAVARHAGLPAPAPADVDATTRVNPSLPGLAVALRRIANRWLTSVDLNPAAPLHAPAAVETVTRAAERVDRLLPGSWRRAPARTIEREVDRLCAGRFGASNRRTAAMTGLDLGRYGYDVAP